MKRRNKKIIDIINSICNSMILPTLLLLLKFRTDIIGCGFLVSIILLLLGGLLMDILNPFIFKLNNGRQLSLAQKLLYQWKSMDKEFKVKIVHFIIVVLLFCAFAFYMTD